MAASDDRVRLDVGFEGAVVLSLSVTAPDADALEERLRRGDGGVAEVDTDEGRLIVVLSHVLYVRRHTRGGRVGFSV
jgi:hypothetical protein